MDELCFVDEEFSVRLLIIEDDLIDAYVRGQLPDGDHKKFEEKYLAAPQLRERVGFAEALKQSGGVAHAVPPDPRAIWQTPWPQRLLRGFSWEAIAARPITAVAAVFLVSVALIVIFKAYQGREGSQIAGPLKPPTPISVQSPNSSPSPRTSPPTTTPPHPAVEPKPAIFVLSPGTRDLANSRSLSVSRKSEKIILKLKLDGERFNRYRAILKMARDEIIVWTSGKLRPTASNKQDFLNVTIPTSKLASRTYVLILKGRQESLQEEDAGEYSFRILLQ